MKHDATVEYDVLAWVKPELDALLDRARQSLEAYVEDQGRAELLAATAQVLRQVRGTLQVVDLSGAVMLAEEMEALIDALVEDRVHKRETALGVLSTAVLQLPDYLEYVQSGHPDTPIIILPLLNDLRAARDAELLSETVVFVSNLAEDQGLPPAGAGAGETADAVAKAKRHVFQLALLGLLRDQQPRRSLERMREIFAALRAASRRPALQRLWWVAGALVETLGEGPAPAAIKAMFGRLDREIRRLVEHGEETVARELPADLLKNMLFYVARTDAGGEQAQAVREAFHLDALLPSEGGLEVARRELSAPNLKLLETVSDAIREDLAEVRDQLEIYTHADDIKEAEFGVTAERLRKIADTLSMLGLGEARDLIGQQAARIDALAQGGGAADDDLLMALASAMLQTEQALQDLLRRRHGATPGAQRGVSDEITAAGVREALRELNRVKDALLSYLSKPEERAELGDAPKVLAGIMAALALMGIEAPLAPMQTIGQRIGELLNRAEPPAPAWIDALAEAITAVEMYLESWAEQRPEQQAFLKRADEALAGLEPLEAAAEEPGADAPPPQDAEPSLPAVEEDAGIESAAAGDGSSEGAEAAAPDETVAAVADEAVAESRADASTSDTVLSPPVEAAEAAEAGPDEDGDPRRQLQALREDADPEILEIFLEEAEEEVERIAELLPRWREDHADEEAMTSIRRSFHTLKGSGRLAGAECLGEFSWAFENMLNRVLDRTVELREEHFRLLGEALPALRSMVEQLTGGTPPAIDLVALMQQADQAALPPAEAAEGPGEAEALESPAEAETEAEAEAVQSPQTEPGLELPPQTELAVTEVNFEAPDFGEDEDFAERTEILVDRLPVPHLAPELLDIYTREVRQQLAVVDDFLLASHGSNFPAALDESLIIALHSLNGSARTAGIESLSTVFAPLEALVSRLQQSGRPLPQSAFGIFQDAVAVAEATLEALPDAEVALPDTAALVARIEALSSGLESSDTRIAPPPVPAGMADMDAVPPADAAEVAPGAEAEPADAEPPAPAVEPPAEIAAEEAPEAEVATAADGAAAAESAEREEPAAEPPPAQAFEPETGADERPAAAEQEGPPAETAPVAPPAADETPAPLPGPGQADYPDVLDAELVAIFLDEADELMAGADTALQEWENGEGEAFAPIGTLQRELHTLKGGARMAGFSTIGDLTHGLETLVTYVAEAGGHPAADGFALLHAALDRLGDMLQRARDGVPVQPQTELIARLAGYGAEAPRNAPADAAPPAPPGAAKAPLTFDWEDGRGAEAATADAEGPAGTAPVATPIPASGEQVRVRAELLDSLVNYAGEVNIYHARLQQQISGFGFSLNELRQTVSRLRDQLRKLELETEAQILYRFQLEQGEQAVDARTDFDPLELDRYSNIQQLSRSLAESLSDLVSIEELLGDEVRDTETLLLQQQRVSTDLQDGLMRSRMVRFGGLAPRLRRIVRQTATELGKRAELQLSGEQSEVDRSVLDRLVAPLEHMLRNAVAHGLESPDDRLVAGKPETGRISVRVAREGAEIVIVVQDDGCGVDVEAVRAKALRQGMISADAHLDDHHVLQLILESGFSTAGEVSQIAGRGVGLDVVVREVKQLGGVLGIESEPGVGTRFVVRLPFTLTITQALLAQAGEHLYALPLSGVEGVVRMPLTQLREVLAEESPGYDYLGTRYDVKPLETLLDGVPVQSPELDGPYCPLLLIRSGDQRVAVQVDSLLGSREVVVKSMGPQFAHLRGVAGATILGDGRVVLILDAADLARLSQARPAFESAAAPAKDDAPQRQLIMVVDDSITIRKVTSRVLERDGFEVMTARDGMDAVAQLEERRPDLLLTDIEMPRMDGYELSSHVRNDSRFSDIPIIMITSRSGEKHRLRARELGVDRYLGKPYQEQELLDSIRELLRERRAEA